MSIRLDKLAAELNGYRFKYGLFGIEAKWHAESWPSGQSELVHVVSIRAPCRDSGRMTTIRGQKIMTEESLVMSTHEFEGVSGHTKDFLLAFARDHVISMMKHEFDEQFVDPTGVRVHEPHEGES